MFRVFGREINTTYPVEFPGILISGNILGAFLLWYVFSRNNMAIILKQQMVILVTASEQTPFSTLTGLKDIHGGLVA
jgi:hypothetical protein